MLHRTVASVALASVLVVVGCAASTEDDGNDTAAAELNACAPPAPSCSGGGGPAAPREESFDHLRSRLASALGEAHHRGRDQVFAPGEPQWLVGKFAYGPTDKDLEDERIDVYVQRGCAGAWDLLGSTRTASDGRRPPVDGVADGGGRAFFEIPKAQALPVGRHRVRMVVAADGTSADVLVDVLPKGAKLVVSDVDGTLTSSENAEFPKLLVGDLPDARPRSADVLQAFAKKGYRIVYVTARAEWLTGRTHAFLAARGFPEGVVRTTTTLTGLTGDAAQAFKTAELARLASHGVRIAWGIGNTASDAEAYDAAAITPLDHRVFFQFTDASHGGRRIEGYEDLLPAVVGQAAVCP